VGKRPPGICHDQHVGHDRCVVRPQAGFLKRFGTESSQLLHRQTFQHASFFLSGWIGDSTPASIDRPPGPTRAICLVTDHGSLVAAEPKLNGTLREVKKVCAFLSLNTSLSRAWSIATARRILLRGKPAAIAVQ
jgi:hypothetical protein